MNYTLITPKGRIYQFYLLATAEVWQKAYGGQLFDNDILVDKVAQTAV